MAGAGERARQTLERTQHFEHLIDLGEAHRRHDRAAIGEKLDQPFDDQIAQTRRHLCVEIGPRDRERTGCRYHRELVHFSRAIWRKSRCHTNSAGGDHRRCSRRYEGKAATASGLPLTGRRGLHAKFKSRLEIRPARRRGLLCRRVRRRPVGAEHRDATGRRAADRKSRLMAGFMVGVS
jgi:hypothetical protein